MTSDREVIETLTARLFALQACVAGMALTHGARGEALTQMDRISELMRVQFLASGLQESALAAFEETVAQMRKMLS